MVKNGIRFSINGKIVEGKEGETLYEVASRYSVEIPTLCLHGALEPEGACRICTVEITKSEWDGWKDYVVSCVYPIKKDLIVTTDSPEVVNIRKTILELLLARCPDSPKIRNMAAEYGITSTDFITSKKKLVSDNCILCRLCTRICEKIGFSAISTVGRGHEKYVTTPAQKPPEDCTGCGSCHRICPTGNIPMIDQGNKRRIWNKEFKLLECKECSKKHITEEYARALIKRNNLPEDYFDVCDECKRKATVKTFKELDDWNRGTGFEKEA
jgi:NADH dehydrogenase/NADH:ubiquinone oxidoreductase subunit G